MFLLLLLLLFLGFFFWVFFLGGGGGWFVTAEIISGINFFCYKAFFFLFKLLTMLMPAQINPKAFELGFMF